MSVPLATYRLQFHAKFTFEDALKIVDYLKALGISDIYASPIMTARQNSSHGYDVIDPTTINEQLGGKEGFERLIGRVKELGLGWLQDIVPNHMGYDSANKLLMDIFEKGPLSKYHQFFDIQWDHPYEHLRNKVLTPFLGDFYGTCLDQGLIKIGFDESGFHARVYDWKLPIRLEWYPKILGSQILSLEGKISGDHEDYLMFLESMDGLKKVPSITDSDERYSQTALMKARLWKLYSTNPAIKDYIDMLIASINGIEGNPHSLDKLDELLSQQVFLLSHWKVGNEELNYRRFFTINGLICLKVENKDTFDYTHETISRLIHQGDITGLRIDHVDGLYSPFDYLNQLRKRHDRIYLVVEKILDVHEKLSCHMPVQGTTGYDFVNALNGLFILRHNEKAIDRLYTTFTGMNINYRNLVVEKKRHFMARFMAGDIDNLALLLRGILSRNRYARDMTMHALRRAIAEIMAHFPVYRSYVCEQETIADQIHIKEAIALAQNTNPVLSHEISFIGNILLLNLRDELAEQDKGAYYHFAKRFQQYSGALMAKSAEDTSFYIYNRFISLNEVGSDPSIFGLSARDFHEWMVKRQKWWPNTMNATATHDTKRGEDVRARLNALSYMPYVWEKQVRLWNRINKRKKQNMPGQKWRAPSRNDEYLIYQTLIGTYPFLDEAKDSYRERLKAYVIKAIREAQMHTNWENPHMDYEDACTTFLEKLLEDQEFLENFLPFQQGVAGLGVFNSLAQIVLKITAPGVPDFYQGTELWDLSLVDPDNRRPVDYDQRMVFLNTIKEREHEPGFFEELLRSCGDGRVKMYVIYKGLALRRQLSDVFVRGSYAPLEINGKRADSYIGYTRAFEGQMAVTVIRRYAEIDDHGKDALLVLPPGFRAWRNVLTGERIEYKPELEAAEVFKLMPLALLVPLYEGGVS